MNADYCTEVIKASCATTIWSDAMPHLIENIQYKTIGGAEPSIEFSWSANRDFDFHHYQLYLSADNGQNFTTFTTTDTIYRIPVSASLSAIKYAVAAVSNNGVESFAEIFSCQTSSITEDSHLTDNFLLFQNYPNPFNPVTTIRYHLPAISQVKITVFDVSGKYHAQLIDKIETAGDHTVQWHARDAGSGVYFYHFQAGGFHQVRKCLLVK